MKDPLVVCSVEWSNSCPFMLGNHAPGEPIRMDGWMDGWMRPHLYETRILKSASCFCVFL
jgi:hypothetical protein